MTRMTPPQSAGSPGTLIKGRPDSSVLTLLPATTVTMPAPSKGVQWQSTSSRVLVKY